MDTPIFGLRFKSNEAVQPSTEDVRSFLETLKKPGGKERHGDDLAKYVRYLNLVEEFETKQKLGVARTEFHEKLHLGALSRSHFFKQPFRSALEQYKYHRHALATLDFKKPSDFIRSAEEEIRGLNPKKKDDQPKIARLQAMVDQRNKDLAALKTRRRELGEELYNITGYIQENLEKIRKLCESSIVVLAGLQVGGEKTGELIEDVKTHFKEQVRDSLQLGQVTKEYIEQLKAEVAELSKQLSQQVLEDVYSVTRVYEAVHDHAKKFSVLLGESLKKIAAGRQASGDGALDLFGKVEQELMALASGFTFETEQRGEAGGANEHGQLLFEKRKEMLDHVFELLKRT